MVRRWLIVVGVVAMLAGLLPAPVAAQVENPDGVDRRGEPESFEPSPPIVDQRGPIDDRFGLGVPGLDDQLRPAPAVERPVPELGRGGETAGERAARPPRAVLDEADLEVVDHGVPPGEREPIGSWVPGESTRELTPGRSADGPPGAAVRVGAGPGWAGERAARVRVLDPVEVAGSLPLGLGFEVRAEPARERGRVRGGQAVEVEIDVAALADEPGNLVERLTVVRGVGCDLGSGACARFVPVDGAEVDAEAGVVRFEVEGADLAANEAERVEVPVGELGSLGVGGEVELAALAGASSGGSYYGLSSGVAGPSSDGSAAR